MQTVVLADFDSGNRRYRMKYLMYSYIYIYRICLLRIRCACLGLEMLLRHQA